VSKRVSVGEITSLRPGPSRGDELLDTVPARMGAPRPANDTGADPGNVVPFMRPREGRAAPPVALPTDTARLSRASLARERAQLAAFLLLSLALHGGLFMVLWREPPPLASVGLEVMSVEIVLGATAPAGVAVTQGEHQINSAATPRTEPTEAEKAETKATAQEQTVEVARQETAPERVQTDAAKAETPSEPTARDTKPEEPKSETAATPETPTAAEQKPAVAMVETPAPDTTTAKPQETPSPPTEVTLLPAQEKPAEKKPDPKAQVAPPKPVKDAKPAKEPRRMAAPTRESMSPEAKASTPSTAANSIGVGRSDRDTNYPGLVAAHLRRYQQYPSDARSRGDQGIATVSFSLDGSGRVMSARLARGSGIASIDQEVQAMVRRASPFPAPPSGRGQSFTVPVRFRLN
jgi:periplasmic protein TonB